MMHLLVLVSYRFLIRCLRVSIRLYLSKILWIGCEDAYLGSVASSSFQIYDFIDSNSYTLKKNMTFSIRSFRRKWGTSYWCRHNYNYHQFFTISTISSSLKFATRSYLHKTENPCGEYFPISSSFNKLSIDLRPKKTTRITATETTKTIDKLIIANVLREEGSFWRIIIGVRVSI